MAKRPWLERTASFGFNIGDRNPGEGKSAIGWAVSSVIIYRYDETTFPNSVPASEGTTLDEHIELTKALKAALKDEGARAVFRWHYPVKKPGE